MVAYIKELLDYQITFGHLMIVYFGYRFGTRLYLLSSELLKRRYKKTYRYPVDIYDADKKDGLEL